MNPARRSAIHHAMVRLSDGDRSAFPTLVDELWPVILAFAQHSVAQEADAEDIAQEVFFRISARIADFDRSRDGLSWAFGIASYEILTHRRRTQRRREAFNAEQVPGIADPGPSQEARVLQQEIKAAFEHVLGDLSEEDRRVLGLIDGATGNASIDAATRKRKQRTLDRLRTLWRNIYADA